MRKITVFCDGCGKDITLTASQHIDLGQSRERDLCMDCYNHISHKLTEVDRDIHFKEDKAFHCGFEESGFHAYNCNDCPNKCEEWYRWDKEMKKGDK